MDSPVKAEGEDAHFGRLVNRWLASLGLITLALLALGFGHPALAATNANCNPAAGNGIGNGAGPDDPADYGAYCWIDFSGYDNNLATGGGQDFIVTLPGGATLTFTLTLTNTNADGDPMVAAASPSWAGASFGHSAFLNIPGKPILYQTLQNNPQGKLTLLSLNLSANGSPDLPFVFIAADGESTDHTESLVFTTSGDPWDLVASPGQNSANYTMPLLTYSNGNKTVTESGNGITGYAGSYVFATDNSPGTVSVVLNGGGLEGVLFGLKFHSIDLALTQTYTGDNFAGGTGSFAITTSNSVSPIQHPPTTPQPIRIVNTLPAKLTYTGFTGSSWTCTAAVQVVTCDLNSPVLLTSSLSLPALAINVQIASSGLAGVNTLTNTATIKDVTPGYVFDTNQTNNTDTAQVNLIHPNLSTSTKTVLDLNGGDAEPGDVLEYTITLKETGGLTASNASVSDDMPLHVGGLTVTNNAGGTDNSTTTGGANGTGKLDIGGITLSANSTKTIVFDVTINAGAQPGDTIDNTVVITNPNGPGGSPAAPTITVQKSQVPASGNKILYVYDNLDLTRTPQSAAGSSGVSITSYAGAQDGAQTWSLSPVLAKALTIKANSTISVTLLVKCSNLNNSGNCRSAGRSEFTTALYDQNGATLTQIGSTSAPASFNHTGYTLVTANIAVGGSAVTVAAGHQLALTITNTTDKDNRPILIEQYDAGNRSSLSLDVSTVINVDSVGTYSDANCSAPVALDYHAGSTVHLCAVVSDPFGAYDIDPTTGGTAPGITITDPSPTQQVIASMIPVAGADTAATRTFVYSYTVPAAPVTGIWTVAVTAWEGTEHTVNRSVSGSFNVAPPSPDLSTSTKDVVDLNGGDAEPGDVLEYTITLKESVGQQATGVSISDVISSKVGDPAVTNAAGGSVNYNSATKTLTITGITVPASNSKIIVYDVTIGASTSAGTKIDNTATVNNPNGNGASAVAPTVTVSQSQVPASGNKLLYVDTSNSLLSRTPQSGIGSGVTIAQNATHDWTLTTALAKDLVVQGPTISVPLLVECTDLNNAGTACRNGGDLHWTAELYDNTVSAGAQIGSTSANASFNHIGYTKETANITLASSAVTILAGHKLILRITNTSASNRSMSIEGYSGSERSVVSLDASTVINVDSVGIYTSNTCATPATSNVYQTQSAVYICAVVSDPFGSADIDPATGGTTPTITITDASNSQQVNAANMILVSSATATKTYSYTYTVPISPPATLALGGWTAAVTAWEGTEHTVSDSGNGSFTVGSPNLVVLKAVAVVSGPVHGTNKPKALPGATMRYTIIITNQGNGPVDNNQFSVADAIPANTTFVAGSIGSSESNSGLSALGAGDIQYSGDGGNTWSTTLPSTVTNVKFSPQGTMNAKSGATVPTYTITFEVVID